MPSLHCMSTNWTDTTNLKHLRCKVYHKNAGTNCRYFWIYCTWPMLSMAWTSCWAQMEGPCSVQSLWNTWREALVHRLFSPSSFDTIWSAERLFLAADLELKMLDCYSKLTMVQLCNTVSTVQKIVSRIKCFAGSIKILKFTPDF